MSPNKVLATICGALLLVSAGAYLHDTLAGAYFPYVRFWCSVSASQRAKHIGNLIGLARDQDIPAVLQILDKCDSPLAIHRALWVIEISKDVRLLPFVRQVLNDKERFSYSYRGLALYVLAKAFDSPESLAALQVVASDEADPLRGIAITYLDEKSSGLNSPLVTEGTRTATSPATPMTPSTVEGVNSPQLTDERK